MGREVRQTVGARLWSKGEALDCNYVEGVWSVDRHTAATVNYARFVAGPFLRETPPGRNISYFAAWLTYKF